MSQSIIEALDRDGGATVRGLSHSGRGVNISSCQDKMVGDTDNLIAVTIHLCPFLDCSNRIHSMLLEFGCRIFCFTVLDFTERLRCMMLTGIKREKKARFFHIIFFKIFVNIAPCSLTKNHFMLLRKIL